MYLTQYKEICEKKGGLLKHVTTAKKFASR